MAQWGLAATTFLFAALCACAPDNQPSPEQNVGNVANDISVSTAPIAEEKSCKEELGLEKASELVKRCSAVSPATHPPCNVENSCKMIQDEIARSCAYLGDATKDPNCVG
jgi:hypothetical protein